MHEFLNPGVQSYLTFNDRGEKNPFWIHKDLTDRGKQICEQLARKGGILGWSRRSLAAAHIKTVEIDELIRAGLIRSDTLRVVAEEILSNMENVAMKKEMDESGGFLALDADDKSFYRDIETATEMIQSNSPEANEIRFRVADRGLYVYLLALL